MQFFRRISPLTSILRTSVPTIIKENTLNCIITRNFSILTPRAVLPTSDNLLSIAPVQLQSSAGFKVRVNLKKRCKDCYFVKREDRLFVICPTHRRHKQMQMVKDERNTWILSHATQGKVRHW